MDVDQTSVTLRSTSSPRTGLNIPVCQTQTDFLQLLFLRIKVSMNISSLAEAAVRGGNSNTNN